MSCEDEEDDRIESLIAEADWCKECDRPIGEGNCDGCIAANVSVYYYYPGGHYWD